ncbi:MAG TPA: 23S rRNA (adenine(2503)-C(2))-methyltransferase RlmN [Terriglobales bacterium]|nr:23S rRNA (adenine(2503)-C(2))-methyltransferase RlmN [Terriglobales bacterium]
MLSPPKNELLGLSLQELSEVVAELGQPEYRARQIFQGMYRHRLPELARFTTLPQSLRSEMAARGFAITQPQLEKRFTSVDGTVRYLFGFPDGQSVETVWMPEGDGGEEGNEDASGPAGSESSQGGRHRKGAGERGARSARVTGRSAWARATICVSSQIGCAVDCRFCMTALLGLHRNLTAGEIVGQVMAVLNDHGVSLPGERVNLVFMGQGEPFLNYQNFMKAVRLLVEGVGIPESHMTVSTAGIVPRIEEFGKEPVRPKLAISLNAPNDELRTQVMPINRKWDSEQLLAAARAFPLRNRERLTFEYVLLGGVNDAPEHAREVARRLRGMRAKVNLIALNPGPGIEFATPVETRTAEFQRILIEAGIPAFVRKPRGRDIYAACGQLKTMAENELVQL